MHKVAPPSEYVSKMPIVSCRQENDRSTVRRPANVVGHIGLSLRRGSVVGASRGPANV